jgi:patatin-like phospholipase/acyl hydrolase
VLIKSLSGQTFGLIDGGVFANNPALCAYAEARNINFSEVFKDKEKPVNPTAKEMMIVSLGNGEVKQPYPYGKFKNAGVLKWIKPLIDIMMSGNSETVDYQLKQLYKTLPPEDFKDYYRIQPEILTADNDLDNGKKKNLLALYRDGIAAVDKNKEQLNTIADKLIANH